MGLRELLREIREEYNQIKVKRRNDLADRFTDSDTLVADVKRELHLDKAYAREISNPLMRRYRLFEIKAADKIAEFLIKVTGAIIRARRSRRREHQPPERPQQ